MSSEKNSTYFTKRLISIQNIKSKDMSVQNLAWEDFRDSMKEKRSCGKRKSY